MQTQIQIFIFIIITAMQVGKAMWPNPLICDPQLRVNIPRLALSSLLPEVPPTSPIHSTLDCVDLYFTATSHFQVKSTLPLQQMAIYSFIFNLFVLYFFAFVVGFAVSNELVSCGWGIWQCLFFSSTDLQKHQAQHKCQQQRIKEKVTLIRLGT